MIARPRMEIQNSLFDLCEPVLKEAGYELVWAQVSGLAGRMKAALYIDKPGGVNVEDCAAVSRLADPLIEGSGLFNSSRPMFFSRAISAKASRIGLIINKAPPEFQKNETKSYFDSEPVQKPAETSVRG